jgi:hypothetical protein
MMRYPSRPTLAALLLSSFCGIVLYWICPASNDNRPQPRQRVIRSLDIPGSTRAARIDEETTKRLKDLIVASDFERFLDSGQFTINNFLGKRLSLIVLSPKTLADYSLGAFDASYDRHLDAVFLDASLVPQRDTISHWASGQQITSEERRHVRFCQFVLLHELGHRAVGAAKRTKFYFGDRWLSEDQFEELKADQWAMKALFSAARPSGAAEEVTLLHDVVDEALRRFFGARFNLVEVPPAHPSMFYRIASLYQASGESLSPTAKSLVEREIASAWAAAHTIESGLERVLQLPSGERVEDCAISDGAVFILTQKGSLYRIMAPEALLSHLDFQRGGTVRRYDSRQVNMAEFVGSITPSSGWVRVAVSGTRPVVVAIQADESHVIDIDKGVVAQSANPWRVQSPAEIALVKADADSLALVLRNGERAVVLVLDLAGKGSRTMIFELGTLAPSKEVEVIGFREDGLLAHVTGVLQEVWTLYPGKQPELLAAAFPAVWGPTMQLAGLAFLGDKEGELVDVWGGRKPPMGENRCDIGNLEATFQAVQILQNGPARVKGEHVDWSTRRLVGFATQPWGLFLGRGGLRQLRAEFGVGQHLGQHGPDRLLDGQADRLFHGRGHRLVEALAHSIEDPIQAVDLAGQRPAGRAVHFHGLAHGS